MRAPGLRRSHRRHPGQPHRRLRWLSQGGDRTIHDSHDREGPGSICVVHGEAGHSRFRRHQPRKSAGRRRGRRRVRSRRRVRAAHATITSGRGDPDPVAHRPQGLSEPPAGRVRLRGRKPGHQPGGGRLPQLSPVARGDASHARQPDLVHHGRRLLDHRPIVNDNVVDDDRRRRAGQWGPGTRGTGYLQPDRSGRLGRLRVPPPHPGRDYHLVDARDLVMTGPYDPGERRTW